MCTKRLTNVHKYGIMIIVRNTKGSAKMRKYDVWVWDKVVKDMCLGAFTVTATCKLHARKTITDMIKRLGNDARTYRICVNRIK